MKKITLLIALLLSCSLGFAQYTIDDTDTTPFEDISGTGTPMGLSDDGEANVVMPFMFDFEGTVSADVRIGNNGGLLFGVTTGDLFAGNAALTSQSPRIVPFWDDLDTEQGDVYYETRGTAPNRRFIVQWEDRPHFSGATNLDPVTFQLVMYETTNEILFVYQDVIFSNASWNNGASATVGVRTAPGNYQYSFNTASVFDGDAIRFSPPVPAFNSTMYAVNGGANVGADDGGALMTIDGFTGVGTVVGTPSPGNGLTGMAIGSDGTAYATTDDGNLITIDLTTGAETSSVGMPNVVQDLAIQPGTNTLYGVLNTGNNTLVTINKVTGAQTVVGNPVSGGSFLAIAFAPDGTLYGLRTNQASDLLTINPTTGAVITSTAMSTLLGALSLAVDPETGLIFFSECCDFTTGNDIYYVDPATGNVTLLGAAGGSRRVHDLAFAPLVIGNPPTISCPMNIVETNDPGVCGATVNFANAVAIDIEDGPIPTTQTVGPASGSVFPVGDTTIEFAATDSDGNTVTCSFTITVTDDEAPAVSCADLTVELDASGNVTVLPGDVATATDNCPGVTMEFQGLGGPMGDITTLFNSNNGGAAGWTVMYDITVGANDLDITGFDMNTSSTSSFNLEVYTLVGTFVGNQTNPGA
ncbi:MAG: HYR domain-containing protein, partial [Flavobacteriaceae bacterium]